MDIRRIPLWESRNATYMSNNLLRTVIEDQGEVAIELSAAAIQGGFVNAVTPPYFRGRGPGVLSDPNSDWWKGRSSFYQAGGVYVSFPSKDEDHILTTNTSWLVRRYGSDGGSGGVWRLSTMKSREEGRAEGKLEEKMDIARKLKNSGISFDVISVSTGLSEEEISSL